MKTTYHKSTQQQLRIALNLSLRDSLKPFALALAIVYMVVTALYMVTTPILVRSLLMNGAAATAVTFLLIWYTLRTRTIAPQFAHPIAAAMSALVLLNTLLHIYVIHRPIDTIIVSLFVVGLGCFFLSWRWLISVSTAALVFSVLISWLAEPVATGWLKFIDIHLGASAMSLFVHYLRIKTLSRLEVVRLREKQQKQHLETALQRLQLNEERFRLLSEAIPLGIFQAGLNGKCEFTNSNFRAITGLDENKSLTCCWNHVIHPSERDKAFKAWEIAAQESKDFSGTFRSAESGEISGWIHISANPVVSDSIVTYVGVVEDITERKSAEEELKFYADDLESAKEQHEKDASRLVHLVEELEEARLRAEESTRAKSEFLANMSHEIRTPMTAILGYTDLLVEEESASENQRDSLNTIKRNGEYLLQIINDILDISKIEAGKLEIEPLRCSPFQMIDEVQSLMQVRAQERGLPLEIEYSGLIPETIETDPTRLRQILVNLVGNAIKFTSTGSVRIVTSFVTRPRVTNDQPACSAESVQSSEDDMETFLQFSVVDSGIGMSEEQLSRLFQPFTQADTSTTRKFGGTGLGLTISKRLANMLGGTIEAEAEMGQGSTFRATVTTGPLNGINMIERSSDHSEQSDHSQPKQQQQEAKPKQQLDARILLAEDGVDNQRLISFILKKAGATVTIADNGQIAADLALGAIDEGTPFDVILMDMQMPVLDGYGAATLLREKGYTRPIIALTAHAMSKDRKKCIDAGCDDYATKPINRTALIAMIQKYSSQAPDQVDQACLS